MKPSLTLDKKKMMCPFLSPTADFRSLKSCPRRNQTSMEYWVRGRLVAYSAKPEK